VVDKGGRIVKVGKAFAEDFFVVNTDDLEKKISLYKENHIEDLYNALVLGLSDYVRKCGFKKAVIGLSGGIDSAVVAVIAADAIGRENVTGVAMPSPYSSHDSVGDARALARNLKIELETIPIGEVYGSYLRTLREQKITGEELTLVEENIQARVRGNILMAISNRTGALVLSTGNKSELAVGYCTLYGDMAGGLAIISDVPKTMVYRLAEYINRTGERIPRSTMEKPPSAELRPGQKDTDSLPPYDVLDQVLHFYIEEHMSVPAIVKKGFDKKLVADVAAKVDRNEYKRRQAAPGLKLTSKAFAAGRVYPIAWKY
jgi:NAD+ synthase (glutamine-hydrolysing)